MANKSTSTRKPMASGTKGCICLVLLAAVLIFVSCLSVIGMPLDAEGVQVLLPWVPVNSANWPASLPLDKNLGGGSYTEYAYTVPEGASLDASLQSMRNRLNAMGETDGSVEIKGDVIRLEIRNMTAALLNDERAIATTPGHFEFKDSNGTVILTEKDATNLKIGMNNNGSTYSVVGEFTLTGEGAQKAADANPAYLTITCDGDPVSSYAIVNNGKINANLGAGEAGYRNAANFAFLLNAGPVDVTLTQTAAGKVPAAGETVLMVIVVLCLALVVCSLIYLVVKGKLTGLSAFLSVWCTVVLGFFFLAAVVIPSTRTVNVAALSVMLLGIVLSIYAAVTRTEAISKQIGEGSAPKAATKIGMKAAAKNVWIAHGAALAVALILMIFPFTSSIGYALSAIVFASALSTLAMRAFQLCFTTITSKPSLFGKVK